jgi:hypothetical protein
MRTCRICGHQLAADSERHACRACEHTVRYYLSALVSELPGLVACLVPGGSTLTGSRFGGRADAPVPLDLRVLNLLGPGPGPAEVGEDLTDVPLVGLLRTWADRLAVAFPSRHSRHGTEYVEPTGGCSAARNRAGGDVTAWCAWLTAYLPYAMDLPLVADLHQDLGQALRNVRAITGTQPRTHVRLAPCPACGACAMTRTDGQWEIVCEACEERLDPDEYAEHAAVVLPRLGLVMARLAAAEVAAVAS